MHDYVEFVADLAERYKRITELLHPSFLVKQQ